MKDCKRAHVRPVEGPSSSSSPPASNSSSSSPPPGAESRTAQLFGERFAQATRQFHDDDEGSDIDLDFDADEFGEIGGGHANAHLAKAHTSVIVTKEGPVPSINPGFIGRPTVINGSVAGTPFVQTNATLPIHMHGSGSLMNKMLVKTVGRLGRWKRVVNSTSSSSSSVKAGSVVPPPALLPPSDSLNGKTKAPSTSSILGNGVRGCTDVSSAFDLELTVELDGERDLLMVNGGVERYLQMIEQTASPQLSPGTNRALGPGSSPASSSRTLGETEETPSSVTDAIPPPLPKKDSNDEAGDGAATPVVVKPTVLDAPEASPLPVQRDVLASTADAAITPAPSGPPPDYDTASLQESVVSTTSSETAPVSSDIERPMTASSSSQSSDTHNSHSRQPSSAQSSSSGAGRGTSIRSLSSVSSFGEPLSSGGQFAGTFRNPATGSLNAPWQFDKNRHVDDNGQFDVQSIDELDFSDGSDSDGGQ